MITEIPPGVKPEQLVAAINDRIRQMNLALGGSTAAIAETPTITYGTHATRLARPVTGFADGSLWIESDTNNAMYQMQGNVWKALDRVIAIDTGTAPANSHVTMKANALGVLSLGCQAADNQVIGMDAEYVASGWVARNASIAIILKNGALLQILGSTGNAVGSASTNTQRITIDLATGDLNLVTGVYKKGGTQVVGA